MRKETKVGVIDDGGSDGADKGRQKRAHVELVDEGLGKVRGWC